MVFHLPTRPGCESFPSTLLLSPKIPHGYELPYALLTLVTFLSSSPFHHQQLTLIPQCSRSTQANARHNTGQ